MLRWLSLALCWLVGCTYQVEDDGVKNGGILDQRAPLIGKSVDFTPNRATGTELVLNGTSVFTQDVPILQVQAERISDPETLVIVIDANAASAPASTAGVVMSQAVLEFSSGSANFGQGTTTVTATGPLTLAQQIVFDVAQGTQIVVPASFVRLSYRYVAMKPAPFAANDIVGPAMHIDASIGYGTKDQSGQISCTLPFANVGAGLNVAFPRVKFATSVEVTWNPYAGAAPSTPADLIFFSAFGAANNIWDARIIGNTLPPPRLPWPNGADGFSFTNSSAAAMNRVFVKQYLNL